MPTLVKPTGNQDHELALNNDPCLMPCKSALGDEGTATTFKRDSTEVAITKVLPAAAAPAAACAPTAAEHFVPDNELEAATKAGEKASPVAPREEGFAGSKAEADLVYAKEWLASQPEVLARVKDVMRQYDAKHYQYNSSSNVPFWRKVLNDLVGKAGQSTLAGGDTANVSSADDEPLDGCNDDDGFYAVDLARVVVQYAKFKRYLPRLHPHYAMKCNNSTPMIAMISALGGSFDCASKGEFCAVLDGGFQTAENIIYAHPDKMINNIQAANRRGVYMCTFDNEDEVEKLRRYMPKAQAVLRIATDDSAAVCEFSSKFGCPFSQTQAVLQCAKDYGIEVIGVSFHVGSGNGSAEAYYKALRDARDIFDRAELLGFNMRLIDIGGGFLGSDPDPKSGKLSFEQIANAVRPLIDELFPPHVHVIAEPGRFFAESPYALAMAIHSKRKLTKRDGTVEVQYYTSDGKYQSYNCMMYDHAEPNIHVLRPDAEAAIRPTTIFGPTCDGIDWIMKGKPFPALDVGDWIFSCDFGAYTMAAGSTFNGFSTKRFEYITSIDVLAM